jgi:hypothetical protein
MRFDQSVYGLVSQKRHVPGEDEHISAEILELSLGLLDGVTGPKLLILNCDLDAGKLINEELGDMFSAKSYDADCAIYFQPLT